MQRIKSIIKGRLQVGIQTMIPNPMMFVHVVQSVSRVSITNIAWSSLLEATGQLSSTGKKKPTRGRNASKEESHWMCIKMSVGYKQARSVHYIMITLY